MWKPEELKTDSRMDYFWYAVNESEPVRYGPFICKQDAVDQCVKLNNEIQTETPEEKEALDRLSTEDFIVVGNPEKFSEFKAKWKGFDTTNAQFESLAVEVNNKRPRTKVVYEKVAFKKVTDIFAILESGEWLYTSNDGYSHIDLCLAMSREPCTMIDREFYRKVEKDIDWNDEAEKFGVIEDCGDVSFNHMLDRDEFISMCHLVASLTDKPE